MGSAEWIGPIGPTKFAAGGGDEVAHSSEWPPNGSSPARSPPTNASRASNPKPIDTIVSRMRPTTATTLNACIAPWVGKVAVPSGWS